MLNNMNIYLYLTWLKWEVTIVEWENSLLLWPCSIANSYMEDYGGFLSHRGSPSHHPLLDGKVYYKPFGGTTFMEPSIFN